MKRENTQSAKGNKMKKLLGIILPLLLCLLVACKKSENNQMVKMQADEEYEKTYYDCGISMYRRINEDILIDGNHIYFGSLTASEDRTEDISFYVSDLYSDQFPKYIGLTCDLVWNMHYTIRHISEDSDGILYLLKADHEGIWVEEYKGNGELKEFLQIPGDTFSEVDILSFAIDNAGNTLILAENSLLGITSSGELVPYETPKVEGFIKVFAIKDKMYCLGRENNNGDYKQKIFSFDRNGCIDKSLEIPDGSLAVTVLEDELCFYVEDLGIFKVDPELEAYQQIVDLSQEKKTWSSITAVVKKGELYGVVYQSLADQAYRTVVFNPEIKRSTDRVEILLYDPMECLEWYCPLEIIESFNETNPYYHISIAEYKKDMNYVLVSEDQPDLILLDEESMLMLGQEGHLCDMSEFLDNDESKLQGEFIDGMIDKISYNHKIYGLPRQFEISTMAIHSSDISDLSGWTIDEFLDWLLSDSSALKESWINKSEILRVCLEGGLNQYINFEKGECYFDQDDFCRHLGKIAEIQEYPTKEMLSSESGKIRYVSLEGFFKLLMRKDNTDPWVYKGFPTFDGKERHIIHFNAISIFQTSKNTEGAFEFVKYFMRYPYDKNYLFHVDYPVLQKIMEIAQTEYWEMMDEPNHLAAVSQDEIDIFLKLYENSEVTDVSSMDIENMVMEEMSFFISGEKALSDVVTIVQNRVQLLLSERKSIVP